MCGEVNTKKREKRTVDVVQLSAIAPQTLGFFLVVAEAGVKKP
jgi:hypothetical protein